MLSIALPLLLVLLPPLLLPPRLAADWRCKRSATALGVVGGAVAGGAVRRGAPLPVLAAPKLLVGRVAGGAELVAWSGYGAACGAAGETLLG